MAKRKKPSKAEIAMQQAREWAAEMGLDVALVAGAMAAVERRGHLRSTLSAQARRTPMTEAEWAALQARRSRHVSTQRPRRLIPIRPDTPDMPEALLPPPLIDEASECPPWDPGEIVLEIFAVGRDLGWECQRIIKRATTDGYRLAAEPDLGDPFVAKLKFTK